MLNRLTPRLILSHLLVIAVAMGLLGFLLLSLVQSYFEQSVRDSLFLQARLVAKALEASPPLSASNVTQALLPPASNAIQQQAQNRAPAGPSAFGIDSATLQISSRLDTWVRVIDATGKVLADSKVTEPDQDLGRVPAQAPLIAERTGGPRKRRHLGQRDVCVRAVLARTARSPAWSPSASPCLTSRPCSWICAAAWQSPPGSP